MNAREEGFLLLASKLGDPERRVLTTAQLRGLALRVEGASRPAKDGELTAGDILALGYGPEEADRIVSLLSERQALHRYLCEGERYGCFPVTRASDSYPVLLRQRLRLDSPGCLWLKGDSNLLQTPAVSLVGSRDLLPRNREFARQVGRQAAAQGLTLVSGNARGADREAQESCLEAGGCVISIVADELWKQPPRRNLLYISEDGYDEEFSVPRALSRNRCIHAMGWIVFVAQATLGHGGTWYGTVKNLQFGWSPVACFRDGSQSSVQLEQMGAYLVGIDDLKDFSGLPEQQSLWEEAT